MDNTQTFSSLIQDILPEQVYPLIHEEIALSYKPDTLIWPELPEAVKGILNLDLSGKIYPIYPIYVVDPYDIFEYCFPFGFRHQKKVDGAKLDRYSDRQTAWDNFFSSSSQIVLMDEHRPELGRLRNRLVKELKTQIKAFEEFEILVKQIYSYTDNVKMQDIDIENLKTEIFQKRLPWLVAAATGELHNGPARFRNILKKLVINHEQTTKDISANWLNDSTKQIHSDIIQSIFRETPFGKDAFKKFIKKLNILSKKNISVDDNRQENLLVDYKVTDRILNINQKFKEKEAELQCRYVVFYLSSDLKSEFISKEIYPHCPELFGTPLNLMRNVSQLWLRFLMAVNIDNLNNNETNLESSEIIIKNLTIAYNTISSRAKLNDIDVNRRIMILRERIEWYGLIKNISAYPEKLKGIFEDLTHKSTFDPLKRAFAELVQTLNNTTGKEGLASFELEIRNYNIQVTVLKKIVQILTTNPSPAISLMGYVVGINHHLPTLFERIDINSKYEKLIFRTVQVILTPNTNGIFSRDLKHLAFDLKEMLINDEIPDIQIGNDGDDIDREIEHYIRQTLLHLFALLLPANNLRKTDTNNANKPDKMYNLDSELDELLLYDINLILRKIKRLNIELSYRNKLILILNNLFYIRVWSLRRNGRLDECELILNKALSLPRISSKDKDLRLIHGSLLLSYSRLMEIFEKNDIDPVGFFKPDEFLKKYWQKVKKDIDLALIAFENTNNTDFDNFPFLKAYSALINSAIYIYTLGYAMSRDYNRLLIARNYLDIKLSNFEDDRRNNPEYLHTEAYLEYMESLYLFEIDKNRSRQKLLFSFNAIMSCLEINSKLFPYKSNDIDYTNLRDKIISFDILNFSSSLFINR